MKRCFRQTMAACVMIAAAMSGCAFDPQPDLPKGPLCAGIAGLACDDGLFCKFETGSCGVTDQSGVCESKPDVCIAVVDPVCGCDGRTYNNECEAEKAGVSVRSDGACP